MTETGKGPEGPKTAGARAREDRLKAALRANLHRRKAQARARAGDDGGKNAGDTSPNGVEPPPAPPRSAPDS
ncbi:hypothetical protein [Phaeovulum vinaykumarii]|uniref:Uncharacterized protein n=1 Tax=Phaeovulum vinaykumarii TaxID=407234 RepID=A0A1N7LAV0_9RHOB|nr:hypothetical protein [Phaeovulum vinaykumarii]SIS70914.1 hypothetical protein SAMN05421795_102766 [Phaeovulum vinaykumarii]SOB98651.1 hypothetical protein SAMN05878426_1026 [Phaeovulum vinaykumarii]